MDALSAILGRKAVREFSKEPVALEQLLKIADAGRHAMSARNRQPWHFVIVREVKTLRELGALCLTGRFVADAPSAIVVLTDQSNERWGAIDCAQAVQNMANAAWALGLGTCWVGHFEGDKIAAMLHVPESWTVFTVLPFGRPAPSRQGRLGPRLRPRRQSVDLDRFGHPAAG